MNVLVTGGAGYIGSHAAKALAEAGHRVVVLDNYSRGHRAAVEALRAATGVDVVAEELELADTAGVRAALQRHEIACVMHFAALAYVGESVEQPLLYYDNNTAGTVSLLKAMDAAGVERLIFSSTCATYGEPGRVPITEDEPQQPINPYGWSKLFIERVLCDYAASRPGFAFAALRYFNVAGCAADGSLGEDHDPETHLIPVLLEAAMGKRAGITIHGEDYDTPDGTCVRDYIHVEDLVEAHRLAMEKLAAGDQWFYNLGIGRGYSVREVLEAAERVTGRRIAHAVGPRRPGDPPVLYADAGRIQRELGWQARWVEIDGVIETAWRWFEGHANGYG
ncbi:MAG: UDP-glucose 4-epimerase GalE [Phycisphaeraceae bacterium]